MFNNDELISNRKSIVKQSAHAHLHNLYDDYGSQPPNPLAPIGNVCNLRSRRRYSKDRGIERREPSKTIQHVAEKGFNEPFELILYIEVHRFKVEKWF
jgi:hypothetical protein